MTNLRYCDAAGCPELAQGAVIVDGEHSGDFCAEHLKKHAEISRRIQDDLDAGVDPSIAVRREQVRLERDEP